MDADRKNNSRHARTGCAAESLGARIIFDHATANASSPFRRYTQSPQLRFREAVFLCYSQKFSLNRPQTFIDNLIVLMRRWQRLQKSPPSAGAHERDQQHHRPDDGAGDVTPQFAVGIIPTSEKQ
jgi:hypothetical protein